MTEIAEDAELVDRDVLAAALRTAAAAWTGPRIPGELPRDVAERVISWSVQDNPLRGSVWYRDGQEGLTVPQAQAAVRCYVLKASVPGHELQAFQAVLDALEAPQASREHQDGPSPDDGYLSRCAHCGGPVPRSRGPLARYCSNAHRQAAWKAKQRETAQRQEPSPRRHQARSGD